VSGWPEILYSHWAKPGDWRAPGITVAVLCADTLNKWFGHSTAQWRGDDSAGPPGQCLCEGREFSSRRQIPDWDEGRTCGRELDNACKADAYDGNQGAVDWVKRNCCGTKPEQIDDVIRVNMVDASGNRAMFDVPMREADSGRPRRGPSVIAPLQIAFIRRIPYGYKKCRRRITARPRMSAQGASSTTCGSTSCSAWSARRGPRHSGAAK
jgi:hypothetical protein